MEGSIKITSSSGKDYLPQATQVISDNFVSDPCIRYMCSSLSPEARAAYHVQYIGSLLKAAMLNAAVFQEAQGFSCVAVWMPPGKHVDNTFTLIQAGFLMALWKLGIGGVKRMLSDFQSQSDACKRSGLVDRQTGKPIKRYHYLFFIATNPSARGQGLASKLVRQQQDIAIKDDMPIWLEATTRKSRDIYSRLGFETVKEMLLGKGTHAESGEFEKGGPGVPLWAMIWRPEFAEKKEVPISSVKPAKEGE